MRLIKAVPRTGGAKNRVRSYVYEGEIQENKNCGE